jgi:hydroxymethylpyrimidine/phosphomethylpyrimidine kinase
LPFRFATVGALYPSVHRGLTADILTAHALGGLAFPVCTAIAMAGRGVVTDFTEVPEDTVRAQFEHLVATTSPSAMKIGVLGSHGAARAALEAAERMDGPIVLDLHLSGPHAETVLSSRGIETVIERLAIPDVVLLGREDAELVSGGEIRSLDDAQVAAQRIIRRGARAVLVKCGRLPARHFEAEGDGGPSGFAADVFYDGSDFALFEAPYLPDAPSDGASSVHAVSLLAGIMRGDSMVTALQHAKRFVTEALRRPLNVGGEDSVHYHWEGQLRPS